MAKYCPECAEPITPGSSACSCGWVNPENKTAPTTCSDCGRPFTNYGYDDRPYCTLHYSTRFSDGWRENLLRKESEKLGIKWGRSGREECISALKANGLAGAIPESVKRSVAMERREEALLESADRPGEADVSGMARDIPNAANGG